MTALMTFASLDLIDTLLTDIVVIRHMSSIMVKPVLKCIGPLCIAHRPSESQAVGLTRVLQCNSVWINVSDICSNAR